MRASLLDPYPRIKIAGVTHRTGPHVPTVLRVLALIPLAIVPLGGMIGGAIGAVGFMGNLSIARGSQASGVKALLMVAVLIVTLVAWVIGVGVFDPVVGMS